MFTAVNDRFTRPALVQRREVEEEARAAEQQRKQLEQQRRQADKSPPSQRAPPPARPPPTATAAVVGGSWPPAAQEDLAKQTRGGDGRAGDAGEGTKPRDKIARKGTKRRKVVKRKLSTPAEHEEDKQRSQQPDPRLADILVVFPPEFRARFQKKEPVSLQCAKIQHTLSQSLVVC